MTATVEHRWGRPNRAAYNDGWSRRCQNGGCTSIWFTDQPQPRSPCEMAPGRRYRPVTVGMWNGEPSVIVCQGCGAAVMDETIHDRWHTGLGGGRSGDPPMSCPDVAGGDDDPSVMENRYEKGLNR